MNVRLKMRPHSRCNVMRNQTTLLGVFVVLYAAVSAVTCETANCTLTDGRPGECRPLEACPGALRLAQRGARPQLCGFASGLSTVPVVCCPTGAGASCPEQRPDPGPAQPAQPSLTCQQVAEQLERDPLPATGTGRVARKKCREFLKDICALPTRPFTAVCPVGGMVANILEFPHMALLGYGSNRENIEYACGGSLISIDFVLTAAHCRTLNEQPVRWVLLGASNRTDPSSTEETRQLIAVKEIIVHPEYRPPRKYNDIALLRLARPAQVAVGRVRPACLHTDLDEDLVGQEAVATGWGATGFAEEGSEQLIKVNLTIRDLEYCKSKVQLPEGAAPQGLLDSHMCAGGEDERDTCQGDSGGPLQTSIRPDKDGCLFRIIGVVSFGPPCGLGKPGVYSRVSAFVPWIEDIVWPTQNDSCFQQIKFHELSSWEKSPTVPIPNAGPGTRARGVCRLYGGSFCRMVGSISTYMQPSLIASQRCRHRFTRTPGDKQFHFGNSPIATLLYGEDTLNRQYGCSGVLISPHFVLTAAHCVKLGCLPVKEVRLGKPHTCVYVSTQHQVTEVHVHPDFDPDTRYNDIALIKLKDPGVDIGFYLPACLQTETDGDAGQSLKAEGWQAHGQWDDLTYELAARNVSVGSRRQCEASLRQGLSASFSTQLPRGVVESQICAGGLCASDKYPGNPGAPLFAPMFTLNHSLNPGAAAHERWYPVQRVVAVEALSSACSGGGPPLPDVFTSVSAFVPWIESVVWPDQS